MWIAFKISLHPKLIKILSLLRLWLYMLLVSLITLFFFFFFFFGFLGLYLQHMYMDSPRLGVESELRLPANATATWDPNCICNLHHSPWLRGA